MARSAWRMDGTAGDQTGNTMRTKENHTIPELTAAWQPLQGNRWLFIDIILCYALWGRDGWNNNRNKWLTLAWGYQLASSLIKHLQGGADVWECLCVSHNRQLRTRDEDNQVISWHVGQWYSRVQWICTRGFNKSQMCFWGSELCLVIHVTRWQGQKQNRWGECLNPICGSESRAVCLIWAENEQRCSCCPVKTDEKEICRGNRRWSLCSLILVLPSKAELEFLAPWLIPPAGNSCFIVGVELNFLSDRHVFCIPVNAWQERGGFTDELGPLRVGGTSVGCSSCLASTSLM